jgi:hypothetical protein
LTNRPEAAQATGERTAADSLRPPGARIAQSRVLDLKPG